MTRHDQEPPIDDFPFLADTQEHERDDDIEGAYERDAVQVSRVDPVTFLEYAFDWKCWPLHEEWQELCSENNRLLLKAPVDHGKTSQISFGRTLWELGRDPELRIALVGSTSENPIKYLGLIKQAILVNPRVNRVFPWLRPERRPGRTAVWWRNKIIVEREDITNKDYSIQALGVAGSIIGSRIDLMIFDDLLDVINTATAEQMQKVIAWIESTAINRLSARGRLWCIGTPWWEGDAMHWMEKKESYTTVAYDADDDLWPELETVAGKEVGWPEWRRKERLAEIGSIEYARSMKCQYLTDSMDIFPMRKFDECMELDGTVGFPEIYRSSDLVIVTGVDLNVKKGQEHDETVFFTGGLSSTGLYQLISIISDRMEIVEILRTMIQVWRRYGPSVYVVEDNAAQAYIRQFIQRHDEVLELIGAQDVESVLRHIRVDPFTTGMNKYSPDYGVRSMVADFEQLKWRIPRDPESLKWRGEMKRYSPSAKLGDRLAASWFCWTKLRSLARRGKMRAVTVGGKRDGQTPDQAGQARRPQAARPRIRVRR